ncbi:hypothetical protein TRVA0_001S02960 [Trichomonascus vanleenenianus]|uniref:uncharacterized protein n=1 Tax=Trichomonascus vanleenenianus TaxID=2268995 RepID=UPI003ECAB014
MEINRKNEAEKHKFYGNEMYKREEYEGAVEEYTKAIRLDPDNPIYYTNRALALNKLKKYVDTIADCDSALEKDEKSFKAYYYKGLAQSELDRLSGAGTNLQKAYELAIDQGSASAAIICREILNVRKKKWEQKERERQKESAPLLAEVREILEKKHHGELRAAEETLTGEELQDEKEYLTNSFNQKIEELETIFARADKKYEPKEIPDYLLDPISFNLFVDPVITKSGNTFERSWILQHLKTNATDPFSRVPLTKEELIPNNQLRTAAEQFIAREGEY